MNDNRAVENGNNMEIVALRLKALHNTIVSLHMALEKEGIEQQALDVIECIGFCVNDIKNNIDNRLVMQKHE